MLEQFLSGKQTAVAKDAPVQSIGRQTESREALLSSATQAGEDERSARQQTIQAAEILSLANMGYGDREKANEAYLSALGSYGKAQGTAEKAATALEQHRGKYGALTAEEKLDEAYKKEDQAQAVLNLLNRGGQYPNISYEQAQKNLADARGEVEALGGKANASALWGTAQQYGGSVVSGAAHGADALVDMGTTQTRAALAQNKAIAESMGQTEQAQLLGRSEERLTAGKESSSVHAALEKAMDFGRNLSAAGAAELEAAKGGKSQAERALIDIGAQALQMGADIALTGGKAAVVPLLLRSFGSATEEALAEGADEGRARIYGAATAAVEMLTEKIADGVAGVYGKGAADDLTDYIVGRLASTDAGRRVWSTVLGAVGEGGEEVLSDLASVFTKSIYNGKTFGENFSSLDAKEIGYDFFLGAAMGFLGGGIEGLRGTQSLSAQFFQNANRSGMTFKEAAQAWDSLNEAAVAAKADAAKVAKGAPSGVELLAPAANISYSREANAILHNPQRLTLFEKTMPGVYDPKASNTQNAANMAQALRQYAQNLAAAEQESAQTPQEAAQTTQTQTEARTQTGAAEAATQEPAAFNADEPGLTAEESYVRGILINSPTYSSANEILDNPAYRRAFELLTGDKLDGSRQQNKQTIVDSAMRPGEEFSVPQLDRNHIGYADGERRSAIQAEAQQQTVRVDGHVPEQETPIEPILVGRATTIYHPYDGETPKQTFARQAPTEISKDSVKKANKAAETARAQAKNTGKSVKSLLPRLLKDFKGPKAVRVLGMVFRGQPYMVDVPNSLPRKLASQSIDVNAFAILENIEEIIASGEYMGSGRAVTKEGAPKKQIVRYDYFETEVNIAGTPYLAKWDVEVVPGSNRYKTHRVINNIDLTDMTVLPAQLDRGLTSERPIGGGTSPTAETLSQTEPVVNRGNFVEEQPAASVNINTSVPLRTAKARLHNTPKGAGTPQQSATFGTVMEANVTPDDFKPLLERKGEKGGFSYIPIANDATVQNAVKSITESGWDMALSSWTKAVARGEAGDQMTAIGALLYNNAVNSGKQTLAMDILLDYQAMLRNTARGLQAARIMQSLTPQTRLFAINRSLQRVAQELKLPDGIALPGELAQQYLEAKDEKARDEIIARMQSAVAKQIPATLAEKANSMRYLSMLGNFRTQLRNLAGNTAMQVLRETKNAIQAGLEAAVYTATGGKIERTASITQSKEMMSAAIRDAGRFMDVLQGVGKLGTETNATDAFMRGVEDERTIFDGRYLSRLLGEDVGGAAAKALEAYRRATNWAMDKGDAIFNSFAYARALGGYLTANGMDASTFAAIVGGQAEATAEQQALIDRARQHAIREAQESTFRDANAISTGFAKMLRGTKAGRFLSNSVFPFRRTPANVALRAVEYSPLGLVDTAIKAVKAQQGTASATEVINSLSKTLTGTALLVVGMALRASGRLQGGEDDEKQAAFNDLTGVQPYSLVGADGSFTIDWLAPAAIPMFMGALLYDLGQEDGLTGDEMFSAVAGILDPMVELSMLQGLSDLLSTAAYSEDRLGTLLAHVATNYLMQYIPGTLGGQFERTAESERMTTFVNQDKTPLTKQIQRSLGNLSAKIPGWDYKQIPYIDAWGRTESNGSIGGRVLENFFSPGYYSPIQETEVDRELQRLYEAGFGNVFPGTVPHNTKIPVYSGAQKSGDRHMSAEEYVEYATARGQTAYEAMEDLVSNRLWADLTDEQKAEAAEQVYALATATAKKAVVSQYSERSAQSLRREGLSVADYALWEALYDNTKTNSAIMAAAAAMNDQSAAEKILLYTLSDSAWEKYQTAAAAGVTMKQYSLFLSKQRAASEARGSDSASQADTLSALRSMPEGIREALWISQGYSTSYEEALRRLA